MLFFIALAMGLALGLTLFAFSVTLAFQDSSAATLSVMGADTLTLVARELTIVGPTKVRAVLEIHNARNQPARHLSVSMAMVSGSNPRLRRFVEPPVTHAVETLAPGESMIIDLPLGGARRQRYVYLYGRIIYGDILRLRHERVVCIRYDTQAAFRSNFLGPQYVTPVRVEAQIVSGDSARQPGAGAVAT